MYKTINMSRLETKTFKIVDLVQRGGVLRSGFTCEQVTDHINDYILDNKEVIGLDEKPVRVVFNGYGELQEIVQEGKDYMPEFLKFIRI